MDGTGDPDGTGAPGAPVALVTGGGGGIGRAICRRLAERGHRVVVADLDATAAGVVAKEVEGQSVGVDVTEPAGSRAAVDAALSQYGRLDVVALNAGVASGMSAYDHVDIAAYRRIVGVNVDGVVFGIDTAVPALRAAGGGSIVVTASLAGLVPMPSDPLYTLTKTAVVGYARALAPPLAEHGIRINALCPGFTDTTILGSARKVFESASFPLLAPTEVADAFVAILDAGRTGEAWFVQPGREPSTYRFRGVPGPVVDGEPVPLPDLKAWGEAAGPAGA